MAFYDFNVPEYLQYNTMQYQDVDTANKINILSK
jgi:hypothetical protein